MNRNEKLQSVARKTRRRLLFSSVTLVLYFSYTLNYTSLGERLGARIGDSYISGSLLMFASLVVLFIALELVFLAINRNQDRGH